MSRVIADQRLREKLHNLESSVEICDEAGRTLGFFLTRQEYEKNDDGLGQSQIHRGGD